MEGEGMMLEIETSKLRKIVNDILSHVEHNLGHSVIRLPEEYYWQVSGEDRYDLTKVDPDFGLGNLWDDWEFLVPLLEDKDQVLAIMLMHVAPILLAIADHVSDIGEAR